MGSVESKLQQVRTRIATACETSQRPVQSVTLLAVTKTFGPQAVRDACVAGLHAFGENFVQEALDKMESLADRGIRVVPDVICNAGGVTVRYFEWVQDFSSFFWTEDEINLRLDKIMVGALRRIWETADQHKITLRTATFAVACERILMAREERGLYP
jgi:hypothetical protein